MYITTSYLGIQKGNLKYLFFLVTEEYIHNSRAVRESLDPFLERFARNLGSVGALVKPFDESVSSTFEEIVNPPGLSQVALQIHDRTPGLLVIDCDFVDFDPAGSQYLYISLRELLDQSGIADLFETQELFDLLITAAREHDLVDAFEKYLRERAREEAASLAREVLEIKPGIFGVSVDILTALRALRHLVKAV